MISQNLQIIRSNKMGRPYVQSDDPSANHNLAVNDLWLNPSAGTMKMWNGSAWVNMQWGDSAIMDDCIANRVIADNISANKITTGVLQSQNGDFSLDLTTGEAKLMKLVMSGEVNGSVIATAQNGLTRIRLRGKDSNSGDVSASIIFEQRESDTDDSWENAGQIYLGYANKLSYSCLQAYSIGKYSVGTPTNAYNAGTADGLMWRSLSSDYLKASYVTYHGMRLASRDTTDDSFANVSPVLTAVGNCMEGTAIVVNGTCTCTYEMNEVMRVDFNLRVSTAGSGSASFGISRDLLRQLNSEIPTITPVDGGTLSIYDANGALLRTYVGATMQADGAYWHPARISSNAITALNESVFASGVTLIGTCYGTYTL